MRNTIVFLILFFTGSAIAQDSLKVATKENPIIFYELYLGGGGATRSAGWIYGGTINYQFFRTDLLTMRIAGFTGFNTEAALIAPTVAIPVFRKEEQIVEYGLLYGKRWVDGGTSFSVSAGISYSNHKYLQEIGEDYYLREQNVGGIPFELNVKFFKSQKRRLRLYYGIIPVTKKRVAFGRSIGFKLSGNISKANYVGFGISYGFGVHKKY